MESKDEYYPLPQPHELSKREKDDAMGAYLMMFAAMGAGLPLPMINLVASIIYYFVNRHKGRFVRFHLVQSLWSQIPVTLLNGFLVLWAVRNFVNNYDFSNMFFGLLWTAVVINIVYFIFSIYAAVQANKGKFHYFVFFGKLAYHQVFKNRNTDELVDHLEKNQPPI